MKILRVFMCTIAILILASCTRDTTNEVIDKLKPIKNSDEESALRSEILDRARNWLSIEDGGELPQGIPYSQNPGSGLDGYRADCSGYISYAWDLEETIPGLYTLTLQEYGIDIPIDELQPGDILVSHHGNDVNNHAVIFVQWLDKDAGSFIAYEENYGFIENGSYKYGAMKREVPPLVLENCGRTSCEISGEGPDGRGPYTAYRHPEIAVLYPENQPALANKLPLEELILLPDFNLPDPLFETILPQDEAGNPVLDSSLSANPEQEIWDASAPFEDQVRSLSEWSDATGNDPTEGGIIYKYIDDTNVVCISGDPIYVVVIQVWQSYSANQLVKDSIERSLISLFLLLFNNDADEANEVLDYYQERMSIAEMNKEYFQIMNSGVGPENKQVHLSIEVNEVGTTYHAMMTVVNN